MSATLRHTINVPSAGTPLLAEVVSIDGIPRIRITNRGFLIGEWPSLDAVIAAGVDLSSVTIKE